MYVPAISFPDGIQSAFDNLENKLSSTNNRTLFGISWPDKNGKIVYKAAAEQKYKDEGKNYGLNIFTITKGTYISALVKDYKKDVAAIGEIFQQLLLYPGLDSNGYCLEWYKGNDVLCMVGLKPVK